MKKLCLLLILSFSLNAGGLKILYNLPTTCNVISEVMENLTSQARTYYDGKRLDLTNLMLSLSKKVHTQSLITAKLFSNSTAIRSLKEDIALEQKKNVFLQKQNNKLDEIESDVLILDNELNNIKNELLLIGLKK